MPDNRKEKHTERVPVYFTESEYMDLLRCAARFDKKPGEFIRYGVRRDMYGSLGMAEFQRNGSDSAFAGLEDDGAP